MWRLMFGNSRGCVVSFVVVVALAVSACGSSTSVGEPATETEAAEAVAGVEEASATSSEGDTEVGATSASPEPQASGASPLERLCFELEQDLLEPIFAVAWDESEPDPGSFNCQRWYSPVDGATSRFRDVRVIGEPATDDAAVRQAQGEGAGSTTASGPVPGEYNGVPTGRWTGTDVPLVMTVLYFDDSNIRVSVTANFDDPPSTEELEQAHDTVLAHVFEQYTSR